MQALSSRDKNKQLREGAPNSLVTHYLYVFAYSKVIFWFKTKFISY